MRGIVDEPELMLVMEYLPPGALSSYLKMYWDKLTTHRLLKFAKDVAKVGRKGDSVCDKRCMSRCGSDFVLFLAIKIDIVTGHLGADNGRLNWLHLALMLLQKCLYDT